MYIPYGRQSVNEDDIQAVVEVLRSDYITTGPKVEDFERTIAAYTGAKYAVAVANGTAALHAACFAAGIEEGDEVITTPITFAASSNCILYCGGQPVFADIDSQTYNISPADIAKKITGKTKAIIAVDYTGQPCEMDEINRIAKEQGIFVIEDAAHALGADYKGKMVGSLSDLTIFSFHPVKHITTGEGGMVLTNDKSLYEKLLLFRAHGITREVEKLSHNEGPWYYEQICLGYNYRISDIQCALGISQMKRLNFFVERRREIAKKYDEEFADIEEIITPFQKKGCNSSWHLYVIQVKEKRKEIFERLRAAGIGVNVHYIPVYYHPYYQKLGFIGQLCPNAEHLYQHIISLPIYPELTPEQQDYVIQQVKAAVYGDDSKAAEFLKDSAYRLKPADETDLEKLFEWANDPECRKNSFHTEPITFEEHKEWFNNKLNAPDSDIYIYYYNDDPVGQVRVDYKGNTAEISYNVDKKFRGRGHGLKMLSLLERELFYDRKNIQCLLAKVKCDNEVSQKIFERLGFVKSSENDFIRYKKEL